MWFSVALCSVFVVVWCGMVWFSVILCSVFGVVWCSVVCCDMVWCVVMWCELAATTKISFKSNIYMYYAAALTGRDPCGYSWLPRGEGSLESLFFLKRLKGDFPRLAPWNPPLPSPPNLSPIFVNNRLSPV